MRFQAGQCRNIFNINDARCRPCTGFDKTYPPPAGKWKQTKGGKE